MKRARTLPAAAGIACVLTALFWLPLVWLQSPWAPALPASAAAPAPPSPTPDSPTPVPADSPERPPACAPGADCPQAGAPFGAITVLAGGADDAADLAADADCTDLAVLSLACRLAAAMDIDEASLLAASLCADGACSDPAGAAELGLAPGTWFPTRGPSFALLATGAIGGRPAGDTDTPPPPLAPLATRPPAEDLAGPANREGGDVVRLHLHLSPPLTATCFALDYTFYTADLPYTTTLAAPGAEQALDLPALGGAPDRIAAPGDLFTAQFDGHPAGKAAGQPPAPQLQVAADGTVTAPGNFAFNAEGAPVTSATMSPTAIFAALTGPPGINVPGAFPLLQLRHPVTGGEPFDLYLTIQDRTDAYADSAVALDNFHWLSPQAVTPPATAQSAPAAPGPTGAGAAAPLEIAPDCSGAKGYSGDRDNDGLPDGWEEHGVHGFGPKAPDDAPAPLEHMDLKAWGAHPDVKDIFVELDAMRPLTPDGYEPLLAPNTIGWVVAAFARAPVDPLPDSTIAAPAYRGIRLHVDYGPSAPLIWAAPVGGSPPPWGDEGRGGHLSVPPLPVLCTGEQCVKDLDGLWSTLDVIRQAEFSPARARVFHYALSAHELAPCSGAMMQISERDCGLDPQISGISRNVGEVEQGASDFVVSLGNAIWEPDTSISETVAIRQAGTFMHELGHNLGLSHYGVPTQAAEFDPPPGDQVDPVRWYLQQAARHMNKPNHLSVMNYLYQTEGLVAVEPSFRLDYARYNMAPLDEAALDEAEGIRLVASGIVLSYTLGVRHYCQSDVISVTVDARTVDWNCGETIDPSAVTHTINADRYEEDEAAVLSVLTSTNEWERLVFTGGALNRQRSLLPPLLAVRAPLPAAASLPCDSPPTP